MFGFLVAFTVVFVVLFSCLLGYVVWLVVLYLFVVLLRAAFWFCCCLFPLISGLLGCYLVWFAYLNVVCFGA